MFFTYPPDELLEPPAARPVYARVDQIEPLDDAERGPFMVLLDCVEAEWLEEISRHIDHLSDEELGEADHRISVIAISSEHLKGVEAEHDDYPEWFHLELGRPDEGPVVEQFHNLFQDPTERGIINARPVTAKQAATLKRLAGWHDIKASASSDIEKALAIQCPVDGVAIYDVGQGAATALLSCGVPILYFDVGGSTLGNWRSFPTPLQQFCTTRQPPIVLSHWDWDHWSSALRDSQLLKDCRWILPLQSRAGDLGAVHARFLAMLKARRSEIYWWDYTIPSITSSVGFTVFRASGPVKNRNESGLALRIQRNNRTALLPGDSSLSSVCRSPSNLDYLMVPHHGGRTSLGSIPTPNDRFKSHLIYSYGVANMYQHPLPKTVRAFRESWKKNAHTALRNCGGLGHVGIDLSKRFLISSPCESEYKLCNSKRCHLGIWQWI